MMLILILRIINEVTDKVTDEICVNKNNEVIQIEVHMNKYGVEEKVKDKAVNIDFVKEKSLQMVSLISIYGRTIVLMFFLFKIFKI